MVRHMCCSVGSLPHNLITYAGCMLDILYITLICLIYFLPLISMTRKEVNSKARGKSLCLRYVNPGRFLSRQSRDKLLEGTGIHTVPLLKHGKLSRADYEELLNTRSNFYDGFIEGIYVRIDEVKSCHACEDDIANLHFLPYRQ